MPQSLPKQPSSDPVRSLDTLRPTPAKAGLRPTAVSEGVRASDPIGHVITEAVLEHYGSVKVAAISLGNVDPSQLMRELKAGNCSKLDADADAKAAVATAMTTAYGRLVDPKDRARRRIRDARQALDELDQFIESA